MRALRLRNAISTFPRTADRRDGAGGENVVAGTGEHIQAQEQEAVSSPIWLGAATTTTATTTTAPAPFQEGAGGAGETGVHAQASLSLPVSAQAVSVGGVSGGEDASEGCGQVFVAEAHRV